ncbi:GNAT family N-acetyltransferase [Clostridiisalibacter paucivorans]|uniref:GNAT family N-acetyltransferase n=1 Tax=Clostridiisalibacter paucivorans TaxID=408753 RepID=UPI000686BD3E|nr:GNAT family N-acetyltransferase [Clostridiisalibacter paucivorans]
MVVAMGKNIYVDNLKIEDVYGMTMWGKHFDPLFYDYNFPSLDQRQAKEWFKLKTKKSNKESFGIYNKKNDIVGFLTIRDIKKIRKHSTLGIVLDPNCLNRGYGTEAIRLFLDYYFEVLKMNSMDLQVAKFNKRAIRCYEKCGFRKIGQYIDKYENQKLDVFSNKLENIRESFIRKDGILYCIYYEMEISTQNKGTFVHNIVDMLISFIKPLKLKTKLWITFKLHQ